MPVTNETPCDDGLLRTDFDQCVDGVCVGTDLCDTTECAPPAACRQEGVCFRGNCTYELLPQGAQCNDSNSASDGDTCSADGNCVSTVVAPNECQLDATCINGECERHAFVMDGTECTDENPDNVCVHAVCMQGQCVQNVFAGNFSCDDNTPATDFDRCYPDGTCKGVDLCDGVECAPPAACRQEGICFRGTCSYALSPANTTCDDGDALTDFDVCDAEGNCAGVDLCVENDVVCEPLSQCHVPGTCANGECSPSLPKPDFALCDDERSDTVGDACQSGVCVASRESRQHQTNTKQNKPTPNNTNQHQTKQTNTKQNKPTPNNTNNTKPTITKPTITKPKQPKQTLVKRMKQLHCVAVERFGCATTFVVLTRGVPLF